nr:MAG TPA: Avd-like-generating retroelement protein [Caudoviricetes sp.]
MPGWKGTKMAVNVGQRNVPDTPANRQLDAGVKARELAEHTIKCCANRKIFLPDYDAGITNDLLMLAKNIYLDVWAANNIQVRDDPEKWKRRSALQERAAVECNNLLALLSLAKSVFHLKSKKVAYWARMTIDARNLIRKWHDGDVKRYGTL